MDETKSQGKWPARTRLIKIYEKGLHVSDPRPFISDPGRDAYQRLYRKIRKNGRCIMDSFLYRSEPMFQKVVLKTICDSYLGNLNDRQKEKLTQYFAREAGIWRYSESHPNILKLFGYVVDPNQILPSLVTPYYQQGSARAYVRRPQNRDLPTRERIRLARDIARGLAFLHGLSPVIVHRDVRSANVLVQETNRSVRGILIDFGSSKLLEMDAIGEVNSTQSYSLQWMPPEYVLFPGDYSRPTAYGDVWSLACTCIEIFTGQDPYPNYTDFEQVHAHEIVPKRPASEHISDQLWDLMQDCWNQDPQQRPTASRAASQLQDLLDW